MPVEWVEGGPLLWEDGSPVLWQSEPIPGPPAPNFPPEPTDRRPARLFNRQVVEGVSIPSLPSSSGRSAPLMASYRIEVRNRTTGLVNPGCRFVEGLIDAEYGRVLDDLSEAQVTVASPDENDGCVACTPVEWEDELVFLRDGNPEPVWQGSIVGVTDSAGELVIRAVDRGANFGDRRASIDHPAIAVEEPTIDPTELARWLIAQAELDGSLGLYVMPPTVDATAALVTAQIASGDLLFDALNDLAGDSLDWTVAGTRLFLGAPTIQLPELPTLDTRLHWMEGGAAIERDGRVIATEVEVIGAGGARAVYAGPAGYQPAVVRPLRLVRERITSTTQLAKLARDVWADSQQAQVVVLTDPSLSPDAPLAVEDLIPGRTLNVHHQRGDRSVTAAQRLTSVSVTIGSVADDSGWSLAELAVQIELEPALRRLTAEG